MNTNSQKCPRTPSILFSFITLACIVGTLITGILILKLDEHILLICCITIIGIACMILGHSWDQILEAMVNGTIKAMPALFFFFLIGMAIGAWVQCGTLPALIYYGLNILSPGWFFPATLIITSLTSISTGSSWTTAGTVGVVLLGIGSTMGLPQPLVAGCILSGAYFGDKMSPLSDTTNLAPAIAGTDVFKHIGAMMYTAVPVYAICLILYSVIGFQYADTQLDTQGIAEIQKAITDSFQITPIVLLPLAVVLILSICKFPALPALLAGVIVAFPISAIFQGEDILSFFDVLNNGNSYSTGVAIVDELLNRGGIQEMMWTFSLGILALVLGGLITISGILKILISKIISKLPSRRFLPACTILTGVAGCACLGEQYMSIVLTGELYKDIYPEKGLKRQMLSRCVEESSTVTAPLFPWTTCGAFMFASLGVPNFEMAPFAFLCWLTPVVGALLPLTGLTLLTENEDEQIRLFKKPHKKTIR